MDPNYNINPHSRIRLPAPTFRNDRMAERLTTVRRGASHRENIGGLPFVYPIVVSYPTGEQE